MPLLNRLVRVGIRANGNELGLIIGAGQFPLQHLCRTFLDKEFCFKIQTGREAHIGMGWARKTIDTAMLAAAIGVNRAVKPNIG